MKTVTTIAGLRTMLDEHRRRGDTVGLVPTMGYLHSGHASLMQRAAAECDVVVASIFVNPLQFGAGEDLDAYPRDLEGDTRTAAAAGTTVLFTPSLDEMYPGGRDAVLTSVSVAELPTVMEGASRPTHFSGMCTVVAKLFNIVGPCHAYFGDKDFQQLAIVRRMVRDLSFPVHVVGCPIVREDDGLAMSSRNVNLSSAERAVAPVLQRALATGAAAIRGGETSPARIRVIMADVIATQDLGVLDYVEVADPDTLQPVESADVRSRLFGAVQFARARLIDNIAASDESDRAAADTIRSGSAAPEGSEAATS